MKRLFQIGLVLAIAAVACGTAQAQQRQRPGGGAGGFGGPLFLLGQKSVQEELKLSDEQVKQVKELADKQRESLQGLRDLSQEERQTKMQEAAKTNDKAISKLLKPEQYKRVRQIALQQQGSRALSNEEVAKALKISEEQKDKIKEIQTKAFEEMRGLGRDEEARKKRQEMMKATNEQVMGVLTAEQKTKLKEMQGEPFTGKIERPQFGGGNRRNRQNQGADKQG
jgi:Spy/CpxP family protein refolding chaperone